MRKDSCTSSIQPLVHVVLVALLSEQARFDKLPTSHFDYVSSNMYPRDLSLSVQLYLTEQLRRLLDFPTLRDNILESAW